MTYTPVIGFEVHLQPKTRTKMFSRVSADYFGKPANTNVDPVTLGLPGALPVPNKEAIQKCIKLALALNCKINQQTKFDRKNYFYPDLPKGYQISQFDKPIGYDGFIEFDINGDSRRIRIKRVHMEEDTGKTIHEGGKFLLDYNKAGVPLIEIVTEPDFADEEEVDKFAKRLRQIVRYLDISDADMEKGQMRYELNISVRKPGESGFPNYKVEVKNIASISVLKKVIEKETERHIEVLKNGGELKQETRGLRGMDGETASQRLKEGSDDYRYFPEPDIAPILISDEWIAEIEQGIVELPQAKKHRYMEEYKLEPDSAETLVSSIPRYKFFEQCISKLSDTANIQTTAREIANWIIGDMSAYIKKAKIKFSQTKVLPEDIIYLIDAISQQKITGSIAKKVLLECFESDTRAEEIVRTQGLEVVSDDSVIEQFVDEVLAANPKVVEDVSKNPNALKFLVGQVMRVSRGKANPNAAEQILKNKLGL